MIEGTHIIGFSRVKSRRNFQAINPATRLPMPEYFSAGSGNEAEAAVALATSSFPAVSGIPGKQRSRFLRAIGEQILQFGEDLLNRAGKESGLPPARLLAERTRTVQQLNLFADLLEEGSWVEAAIDNAEPGRLPAPRPAICRMLIPLGPVVVFGAGNFPLAFSVAGGDTVSALAGGNPVIVKAHPGHPGTSELVGSAIIQAALQTGMPEGIFSLLFDDGFTVGEALVSHPGVRAVAFTGSYRGGMALHQLANRRSEPIPVFAEMGSINPVILLPGALAKRTEALAAQCASSVTQGIGQFCTCPGLFLAINSPGIGKFIQFFGLAIESAPVATMLSADTASGFRRASAEMLEQYGVELIARSALEDPAAFNQGHPLVAKVSGKDFLINPRLQLEVFGPFSLLVCCEDLKQLESIIEQLTGQLTISVMAEPEDLADFRGFQERISRKAGRLIFNGLPTGVEVCAAMQHGGPFPATTDPRFTSVGTFAIKRFVRPLTYQNWEDALLPDELKSDNPLGILRLVDNKLNK